MSEQPSLFASHLYDPARAKKGKDSCPTCKRKIRWYAKTLDKRLVEILAEIMWYTQRRFTPFELKYALKGDHHKINDAQKLHYWSLIKKNPKTSTWKLTRLAGQFVNDSVKLPYRVWVFNNEVMEESTENMVSIQQVDPRWQISRSDWSMDYIPMILEINKSL